jgi:hypothetical protein
MRPDARPHLAIHLSIDRRSQILPLYLCIPIIAKLATLEDAATSCLYSM